MPNDSLASADQPSPQRQESLPSRLLGMVRFSHTLFALPFALTSALLAWGTELPDSSRVEFQWWHLVGLLVCMVGARSAAMAFNRLVDRKIDGLNPRTRSRHLPAGTLTIPQVTVFIVISSLIFVAGTLLFLPNRVPLVLAVPVLAWLCGYSYAKRFTSLAHFWLGVALALSPIAAWLALRGETVLQQPTDLVPALVLGAIVLFWVAGFDTIYACQDQEFDAAAGLHSIPAKFGVRGALRIAAACHGVMFVCLWLLPISHRLGGPDLQLSWIYATSAIAIGVLLVAEHALVKHDDLERLNVAFFQVNVVVALTLLVAIGLELLW